MRILRFLYTALFDYEQPWRTHPALFMTVLLLYGIGNTTGIDTLVVSGHVLLVFFMLPFVPFIISVPVRLPILISLAVAEKGVGETNLNRFLHRHRILNKVRNWAEDLG